MQKEIEELMLNEPTYFALVLKGKYKDFLELKKTLESITHARLIYQRLSPTMLWIVEQKPVNLSSNVKREER